MMEAMRRRYLMRLTFNGRSLNQVVIDPHYEAKHSNEVNDELILELVRTLNGRNFDPETTDANGFEYYWLDIPLNGRNYRLVWLIAPDRSYLGVVNAYRRTYGKKSRS